MRRLVGWAVAVALLGLVPAGAATAAERPAALSVSIKDDVDQVKAGDHVDYVAKLANDGASDVAGRLVITVPSYVRITEAAGGHRDGADVSWKVVVPAGGQVNEKLSAVVGRVPPAELRMTTLVSIYLGDDAHPVIRSAEADSIAGVTDPAHAVKGDARRTGGSIMPLVGWVSAVVVVLAASTAGLAWWRRRHAVRDRLHG